MDIAEPTPSSADRADTLDPTRSRARSLRGWFGRIDVRAGFISLLILCVVGAFALSAFTILEQQTRIIEELGVRERLADEAVDSLASQIADFSAGFASVIAGVLQPTVAASRMTRIADQLVASFSAVESQLGPLIDPVVFGGGRDMAQRLPEFGERVRDAFAARRRAEFAPLHEEWLDYQVAFNRLASAARQVVKDRGDANLAAARQLAERGRVITIVATLGGMLGTILVWFVLVSVLARPIGAVARSMGKVARGDVDADVPMMGRVDQIGDMARAVLVFRENLRSSRILVSQALGGARRTAIATTQASEAIGQVADGAATQLSELREVAQALSQSTDAIRDVGRTTQEAHDRTDEAKALLDKSLRKVRGLIELVDAVGEDTNRVTRIAATIAKVATQTNILAINAAIEAARAGEHGRGLAVVAEEVRQLAANTENLAQEIADVVRSAGERTREGSRTAADVGATMDELELLVSDSARLAGVIAVAMEEQQVTVAELDDRIATLTRIGQSSATAAEEITVTMIDLARLAEETRSAVESVAGNAAEDKR